MPFPRFPTTNLSCLFSPIPPHHINEPVAPSINYGYWK